jgi:hypothetical protein
VAAGLQAAGNSSRPWSAPGLAGWPGLDRTGAGRRLVARLWRGVARVALHFSGLRRQRRGREPAACKKPSKTRAFCREATLALGRRAGRPAPGAAAAPGLWARQQRWRPGLRLLVWIILQR